PFDPSSDMHQRAESGVYELEKGWLSLDTGKLIFGSWHANKIVNIIERYFKRPADSATVNTKNLDDKQINNPPPMYRQRNGPFRESENER
ncbi:unnamed protein product, partial [Didymodactylos carnosus]